MGRMMIKLFKENNIPVINIIRREEQAQFLINRFGLPADGVYVLNSESDTFA